MESLGSLAEFLGRYFLLSFNKDIGCDWINIFECFL